MGHLPQELNTHTFYQLHRQIVAGHDNHRPLNVLAEFGYDSRIPLSHIYFPLAGSRAGPDCIR